MSETPAAGRRVHRGLIWAGVVVAAIVAVGIWMAVVIAQDNDYKDAAERACVEDVTAKYHDRDPTVFALFEGRDGDRLEFTAVDTLAEFHWT